MSEERKDCFARMWLEGSTNIYWMCVERQLERDHDDSKEIWEDINVAQSELHFFNISRLAHGLVEEHVPR